MTQLRLRAISVACVPILLAFAPLVGVAQTRQNVGVNWKAATADLAKARATPDYKTRSGNPSEAELNKIRVPVLALDQGKVRAAPRIHGLGRSYVAAYSVEGATISLTGTASASLPPASSSVGKSITSGTPKPTFEVTEDGADLTFQRYGAGYVLRISCAKEEDERCLKEDFLRGLERELIMVGGKK